MPEKTIRNIVDAIGNGHSFLLTTHENPDGDAVGSSLALASFLRKTGKDVVVHYRDPVPELLRFLPGSETIHAHIPDRDFDVAFVLDVGELKRAGAEFCSFNRTSVVINLDHHLSCEHFGALNLIDPEAAATGSLVYRIIKASDYDMDEETALCLYVSVISDTGSFRYSNANREAFAIAGEMTECGVNPWNVAERLYENQPRERLELLALSLPTLEIFANGEAASLAVTLSMYAASGANSEVTDGFINYPRSIKGVEVAVFFRQLDGNSYKIGFRSKGTVNVAAFAAALGGGGHHNAAGCVLSGSLDEIKSKVYAIVNNSL